MTFIAAATMDPALFISAVRGQGGRLKLITSTVDDVAENTAMSAVPPKWTGAIRALPPGAENLDALADDFAAPTRIGDFQDEEGQGGDVP